MVLVQYTYKNTLVGGNNIILKWNLRFTLIHVLAFDGETVAGYTRLRIRVPAPIGGHRGQR